jgi:hypothetical protein
MRDADFPPDAPASDEVLAERRALLDGIAADERDRARLYARAMRRRAELERSYRGEWHGHQVVELAGTARIPQTRAGRQLEEARRLVQVLPATLALLESGELFVSSAEQLLWLARNCSDPVLAEVERRVLPRLVGANSVDGHRLVTRAIAEAEAVLDPEGVQGRHEQARQQRSVWVNEEVDGMAVVGASMDQVSARRWSLDVEEIVRAQGVLDAADGVVRTTAQRRADVVAELPGRFLALVQAVQRGEAPQLDDVLRLPVRNPVTMYVHVPVTTVLDLDHRVATLEGGGLLSAFQARLLRPVASLARLWVDCGTGVPIGIDPKAQPPVGEPDWQDEDDVARVAATVRERLRGMLRPTAVRDDPVDRHDPSAEQRRFVQVRDVTCTGVGCSRAAGRCEVDHEIRYVEGPTAVWNLSAKSPRCHHVKHAGWQVTRNEDGSCSWTSPLGREYTRSSPWEPWPELPFDLTLPEPTLDRPAGPPEPPSARPALPLWDGPAPNPSADESAPAEWPDPDF